jgi:hypothetical protein
MSKSKIAITLEAATVAKLKARVRSGRSPSVSAYISKVVSESLESDSMDALIADMKKERGEPSPEAKAWARKVLGK